MIDLNLILVLWFYKEKWLLVGRFEFVIIVLWLFNSFKSINLMVIFFMIISNFIYYISF